MRVGPYDDPDRYELSELHSRGGEGELWSGRLDVDGTPIKVAIKVIYPGNTDVEAWRERWRRQAEVLRSLDHPGLVKVREVFEGATAHQSGERGDDRSLYLVMNWVDGVTLEEWVARNPDRDVIDVCRIASRLANAVDYLHSGPVGGVSVLHRDIKPSNVLVVGGNDARLIDFGLTRLLNDQPMSIVGTPSYLAPEVVPTGHFTPAADRFSLGATVYFALTGRQPDATDPDGMRAALISVPGAEGRDDLAEHVLSMMDPDPTRRPASTVGWAAALAAGALSQTTPTTILRSQAAAWSAPTPAPVKTPGAVPAPPPRRRRRTALWIGLAAVVAALIGAGAVVAITGGGDEQVQVGAGGSTTPSTAATTTSAPTTTEPATTTTVPAIPDVVGLSADTARRQLEALGMTVTVQQQESTGTPGTVRSVSPPTGSRSTGAAVITIITPPTVMPDLVGKRLSDGTNELQALGASPQVTEKLDDSQPDGAILEQTPRAGEPFSATPAIVVARRAEAFLLSDFKPVAGGSEIGQAKANAVLYTNTLFTRVYGAGNCCPNQASVEYDLSKQYRILHLDLALRDDSDSGGQVIFEVMVDGREVLKEQVGLKQTLTRDLDVTDGLRLRLQVTGVGAPGASYPVFGDPRLLAAPGQVTTTTTP